MPTVQELDFKVGVFVEQVLVELEPCCEQGYLVKGCDISSTMKTIAACDFRTSVDTLPAGVKAIYDNAVQHPSSTNDYRVIRDKLRDAAKKS